MKNDSHTTLNFRNYIEKDNFVITKNLAKGIHEEFNTCVTELSTLQAEVKILINSWENNKDDFLNIFNDKIQNLKKLTK